MRPPQPCTQRSRWPLFLSAHTSGAAPSHSNSSDNFRSLGEGSKGCKSHSSDPGSLTGGGSKTLFVFQLLLMRLSLSCRKPRAKPPLPLFRQHQGYCICPEHGKTRLQAAEPAPAAQHLCYNPLHSADALHQSRAHSPSLWKCLALTQINSY